MKQSFLTAVLASVAVAALTVGTLAYAGTTAGTGIVGSKHDINAYAAMQAPGSVLADNEGRVCAFCHTPHAAVIDASQGPMWSHMVSAKPYQIFNPGNNNESAFLVTMRGGDPLAGSSRLCMSCHDGQIAVDSHMGSGSQANGTFVLTGGSVIGSTTSTTSDHPIGMPYNNYPTEQPNHYRASTNNWSNGNGHTIAESLETADGIVTCATCHDVHNKKVATQTASLDGITRNPLLRAKNQGSAICKSCHTL